MGHPNVPVVWRWVRWGDRLWLLHQGSLAQLWILLLWWKKGKTWGDTRANLPTWTVPLNRHGRATVPMLIGQSTSSVDFPCTFTPQSLMSVSLPSSVFTIFKWTSVPSAEFLCASLQAQSHSIPICISWLVQLASNLSSSGVKRVLSVLGWQNQALLCYCQYRIIKAN